MKPRRTHRSHLVIELAGGNEDNHIWGERIAVDGIPAFSSVWVPTDEERAAIAAGENIELIILGIEHPPVSISVSDVELGKAPAS